MDSAQDPLVLEVTENAHRLESLLREHEEKVRTARAGRESMKVREKELEKALLTVQAELKQEQELTKKVMKRAPKVDDVGIWLAMNRFQEAHTTTETAPRLQAIESRHVQVSTSNFHTTVHGPIDASTTEHPPIDFVVPTLGFPHVFNDPPTSTVPTIAATHAGRKVLGDLTPVQASPNSIVYAQRDSKRPKRTKSGKRFTAVEDGDGIVKASRRSNRLGKGTLSTAY